MKRLPRLGATLLIALLLATPLASAAAAATSVAYCTTKQLVMVIAPNVKGVSGERFDAYALVNRTTACRLDGYPKIALLNNKSKALAFLYSHAKNPYTSSGAATSVVLAKYARAYFLVAKHQCSSGAVATATIIRIRLPNVAGTIAVTASKAPSKGGTDNQLAFCRGDEHGSDQIVYVSPVVKSPSAIAAEN